MPDTKLVATTVAIPDPVIPYGRNQGQYDSLVGWVISGAGALIAASFWLRRRVSRDGAEIAKDRAETDIVKTALEERDRAMREAREAWATRTDDAKKIANLETENSYLKRDVESLKSRVNELSEQLALALNAIRTIKPDFILTPTPTQPA